MKYHIIQQQVFDIYYANRDNAARVQNEISRIFNSVVFREMELVFTELIPPGETIKIDSLKIDAGTVALEELEATLPALVIQALKDALNGYIQQHPVDNSSLAHTEAAYNESTLLGVLEYYLRSGTLPWWAAADTMDTLAIINILLSSKPDAILTLLLTLRSNIYVHQRIAHQYPEQTIVKIVELIEPGGSAFIVHYHRDVCVLQAEKQLLKADLSTIKKKVWQFILTYLFTEYSSVFSEKMFVKSNLTSIASFFNISYLEVLDLFAEALSTTTATDKISQHLIGTIQLLKADNTQPNASKATNATLEKKEKSNHAKENFLLFEFFLINGYWPWWANKSTDTQPNKLFNTLFSDDQLALASLFIKTANSVAIAKNITAHFNEDVFRSITRMVQPSSAEFVFAYNDYLLFMFTGAGSIAQNAYGLPRKIWEFTLGYLTAAEGLFNPTLFIRNSLARVASYLNVNYSNTVGFLLPTDNEKKAPGPEWAMVKEIVLTLNNELLIGKSGKEISQAINGVENNNDVVSQYDDDFESIRYYILNGSLPLWSTVYTYSHATVVLRKLLATMTEQMINFISLNARSQTNRRRLLKILDAEIINTAAAFLLPAHTFFIHAYTKAIISVSGINLQSGAVGDGEVKADALAAILFYMLDTKKDFKEELFLIHIVNYLSHKLTISNTKLYAYLAQSIIQQHQGSAGYNLLVGTLANIKSKPQVSFNNIAIQPETYLQTGVNAGLVQLPYKLTADALKYYTVYGTMPWWLGDDKSETPNNLLQQLLANWSGVALTAFKFAATDDLMMERWVNNISAPLLQQIIRLLPDGEEALKTIGVVAKAVEMHTVNSFFTKDAINNLLYIALWKEYNTSGYQGIDRNKFIINFIHSIEFILQMPQGGLINSLANNISAAYKASNQPWSGGYLLMYAKGHTKKINNIVKHTDGYIGQTTKLLSDGLPVGFIGQTSNTTKYDISYVLGLYKAENFEIRPGDEFEVISNIELEKIIVYFLYNNKLPQNYCHLKIDSALHFYFLHSQGKLSLLLGDISLKKYSKEAAFYLYHILSFRQDETEALNLLHEHFEKETNSLLYLHPAEDENVPMVSDSGTSPSLHKNNFLFGVSYSNVTEYIKHKNNIEDESENVWDEAGRILDGFMLRNILPEDLQKLPKPLQDNFLKNLIVLLMHKKPGYLQNMFKAGAYLPANSIRIHRLFNKGENIEERTVLLILNRHIEDDIATLLKNVKESPDSEETLQQYLAIWRNTYTSVQRAVFLHSLIQKQPQIVYYLPRYLYMQEVYDIAEQNTTPANKQYLFFIRQLQVILNNVNMPASTEKQVMLLYQSYTLSFAAGRAPFTNFIQLINSFFSYLEEENKNLLTTLYRAALHFLETKAIDSPVLKNNIAQIKQMLLQRMSVFSKNILYSIPYPQNEISTAVKTQPENKDQRLNVQPSKKIIYPAVKQDSTDEKYFEKMYINNAGIVLFHPFFATYFSRVSLTSNGKFINMEAQLRAVHLLQYLVDGLQTHPEYILPLNKILCNLPVYQPIDDSFEITQAEEEVTGQLFSAVKQQWDKLQNTSTEGIRTSFFQRQGILGETSEGWNLRVDQKPYDIILQTLPWGLNMVKTPWMDKILTVEWT